MNVAVQAILKMITNVSRGHANDTFNNMLAVHGTTFSEALAHDPIVCGHTIVQVCHTSGQCCEHLRQLIIDGNAKDTFGPPDTPMQVPDVALLCDVDTRWDSVYLMICCLRVLCQVCVCASYRKPPS